MTKVFLVDDEIVIREGIRNAFDWDDSGVQFALDPFERATPPAIPAR